MEKQKVYKRKKHYWFKFWRFVAKVTFGKHQTFWDEPFKNEPSVFVCNHERAYGPIAMMACFPLRDSVNPWIIAEVCHAKTTPNYIRHDFWWKQDKWYTKILDYTVPYPIALILPPTLRGSEPIEVHHDASVISTFKQSLEVLEHNRNIVLFPEKPLEYAEYSQSLYDGFVNIARLYVKKTGKPLNFYPVYIDKKSKTFHVGKPEVATTFDKTKLHEQEIGKKLEKSLSELKSKYN
ncbi:MAG: hypothetical protein RR107_05205 [Clostridia bacterium]